MPGGTVVLQPGWSDGQKIKTKTTKAVMSKRHDANQSNNTQPTATDIAINQHWFVANIVSVQVCCMHTVVAKQFIKS